MSPVPSAPTIDVIVYGCICVDTIWRINTLPPPGGYAAVLDERVVVGGEAANTAIALGLWKLRVSLMGNYLGDDPAAQTVFDGFASAAPAVDISGILSQSGRMTPACLCIASHDGHRTTFCKGFESIDGPAIAVLPDARLFTMDPNVGRAGIVAARLAHAHAIPIVAMDCLRSAEITRLSDTSITSSEFCEPGSSLHDLARRAGGVRDAFDCTAIITHGPEGCLVAERSQSAVIHFPAYHAPAMIDPTGSGDAFRAGLIYGRLQGWSLEESVRFGSAAGALNCGGMGGWGGVQTVAATRKFQQAQRADPSRRIL